MPTRCRLRLLPFTARHFADDETRKLAAPVKLRSPHHPSLGLPLCWVHHLPDVDSTRTDLEVRQRITDGRVSIQHAERLADRVGRIETSHDGRCRVFSSDRAVADVGADADLTRSLLVG
jgi:hypothetical protein